MALKFYQKRFKEHAGKHYGIINLGQHGNGRNFPLGQFWLEGNFPTVEAVRSE